MTIPATASRRHANPSAPAIDRATPAKAQAPSNPDPLDFGEPVEPPGDEIDRLTRPWLYMPGNQVTNGGLDPRYAHRLHDDKLVTRGELRREVERMEAAMASFRAEVVKPIRVLIDAVKELRAENAALREELSARKSRPAARKSPGARTTRGSKKGGTRT